MRVWGLIRLAWELLRYMVALWHTLRRPVARPIDICGSPRKCRRSHRLAMVFRPGKAGQFVLVH